MDSVEANLKLIDVKALKEKIEDLDNIHNATMEQQQENYLQRRSRLQNELNIIQDELRAFMMQNKDQLMHTKTLSKYILPQGNLIINKSLSKMVKQDDEAVLSWAEEKAPYLVKETVNKKVDWMQLKNNLCIANNQIINKNTGEILEIPGIELQETKEDFIIKF